MLFNKCKHGLCSFDIRVDLGIKGVHRLIICRMIARDEVSAQLQKRRNFKQADDDSSEDGEVRAQDTLPNKGQRLGKDGRPVTTHAGRELVHNSEQAQVDLLKEENGETTDPEDSGGEEDKANTHVPFAPQTKTTRSQEGTSTPSETTEAAGFGSDTSPRTESGDNDELSRAGPN